MTPCPCHSGKPYQDCCQSYHQSSPAPTAEALMRSRYAAYALRLSDYIIESTHPDFRKELTHASIEAFSDATQFQDLTIESHHEEGNRAIVTFYAKLSQNGRDASFRETSKFERLAGRWYYQEGVVS